MSRSNYSDECEDPLALGRWRGRVTSALKGKRGQAALRELLAALDAMPDKRLYSGSFARPDGEFCTLGVLGSARGLRMDDLGDSDYGCDADEVGVRFDIAGPMAAEIMFLNDEQINDFEWKTVDICGPVRPLYPDWGRTTKEINVPSLNAPERRWKFMRDWVAKQILEAKPSTLAV